MIRGWDIGVTMAAMNVVKVRPKIRTDDTAHSSSL
jgi:hypothetical protein